MSKIFKSLGLMSGTSLDGIDAAMIKTDGEKIYEIGPKLSYDYSNSERDVLRRALDITPKLKADLASNNIKESLLTNSVEITEADKLITKSHINVISMIISNANNEWQKPDIIGFHGQTIYHNPKKQITLQIGNPQTLANQFNIPIIADFRENDIKNGGQGAPLVPIYHQALANKLQLSLPIIFLNIGGVANITYISDKSDEQNKILLAFDTGPGNALMDDLMIKYMKEKYDKYGNLASSGIIDDQIMSKLTKNPFFNLSPPKSLDRNHFKLPNEFKTLSLKDKMATLNAFTAIAISKSLDYIKSYPKNWIICGGGRKNKQLISNIHHYLQQNYYKGKKFEFIISDNIKSDEVKLDGDFIEAQAFAYLAVRSLKNLPLTFPFTTGVNKPLLGGNKYIPNNQC